MEWLITDVLHLNLKELCFKKDYDNKNIKHYFECKKLTKKWEKNAPNSFQTIKNILNENRE